MNLNIICLNCQKNYNKNLSAYLKKILKQEKYDILMLQEASEKVNEVIGLFQKYNLLKTRNKERLCLTTIVYKKKF
jgi:hypothetical protein